MSIKSLFTRNTNTKLIGYSSNESLKTERESSDLLKEKIKQQNTFIPEVDFSDPKNTEKLYMPYVSSGLDTKNHHLISNFINDINKKSHLNNIAKLTTDKDFIDHYFDILHAEIYKDPSSKDFNLNDIYSILEDGNNTFLNNLPLTDIYTCYNHILKEKIEFAESRLKLFQRIVHRIKEEIRELKEKVNNKGE
jgi:hypothetical protein